MHVLFSVFLCQAVKIPFITYSWLQDTASPTQDEAFFPLQTPGLLQHPSKHLLIFTRHSRPMFKEAPRVFPKGHAAVHPCPCSTSSVTPSAKPRVLR